MTSPNLRELLRRRDEAEQAAHELLERHEAASSRVLFLKQSFGKLSGLPVDVAGYYQEALEALQVGCYRASIVLSWAGFVYVVAETLVSTYAGPLASNYPKWNTGTTSNLLESAPEYQILEAAKKLGAINNQQLNIYKGWLSTRNQSAHPTLHKPSRNVALGYVDAVIAEVQKYL